MVVPSVRHEGLAGRVRDPGGRTGRYVIFAEPLAELADYADDLR
jgi:hypothetical protein